MLARLTRPFADVYNPGSLANQFRHKRFQLAGRLLAGVPHPWRILDIGGTDNFWNQMGSPDGPDDELILLNLEPMAVSRSNRKSMVGDAAHLGQFRDGEFDIVFSNSVIEHLGSLEEQQRMAAEVRRVGKRYYVQTPHRYFPIEPHFLFPFFQFFPLPLKLWLLTHFALGWYPVSPDREAARKAVDEIRLVSRTEMEAFFPGATIYEEKLLGMTKSFVAYHGWASVPAADMVAAS
jgi:SAM-dependent methyltransferase